MNQNHCKTCDIKFKSRTNYVTHMREKHKKCLQRQYKCQQCGKNFMRKNNLQQHSRTHLEIDEREFECEHCGFKCNQKANLNRHIMRKHTLPFLCKKPCGVRFPTQEEFLAHRMEASCANFVQRSTTSSPSPQPPSDAADSEDSSMSQATIGPLSDDTATDDSDSWCHCPHLDRDLHLFMHEDGSGVEFDYTIDDLNEQLQSMDL